MKFVPIAALLLGLSAGLALAQPASHKHGGAPMSPLMKLLDANTNGVLEATEISNAPAALKTLDTNGDGTVSAAELSVLTKGRHQPPDALLRAIDTNHDGALSAEEISNAPAALLKLDSNGDGKLSQDELRPARSGHAFGSTNSVSGEEPGMMGPPPGGEGGPEGGPHEGPQGGPDE